MTDAGSSRADITGGPKEPWGNAVLVEFEDAITWVSMNRPDKRNAMNPVMNREMNEVLDALEIDDRCGVLVLTGSGESFSAGMDLKEYFRETDDKPRMVQMRARRDAFSWQGQKLMNFAKPTIAMVNGWCFGGAFTPMASCDLAIAADEATFGVSEINWGILPGGNVTKVLSQLIGRRAALYAIMTGIPFDGKRAAAMGLVNESVPLAGLREMRRVTRPGGRLVVCEFSHPTNGAFRTVYLEYLMKALPAIARAVSSSPDAYVYLAESIRAWPDQRGLSELIAEAGWQAPEWRNLSGGIVALHRAKS